MYNAGWDTAKALLGEGNLPAQVIKEYDSDSIFDIGVRDCIQQYLKTSKAEMIKVAACVFVIDPDTGKVLACTRRGTIDDWGVVGGKTDGESPLNAAIREFEEEAAWKLKHAPHYIGCFVDEQAWDIHCFIVSDKNEAREICDMYRDGYKENEPGILTGLVPYHYLMEKTFGEFNTMMLTYVLQFLAK